MLSPEGAAPERAPIELVVRYRRMNAFFADYVKNISRGGTFVATEQPLPADTEFELLIGVPALAEPLALRARVIWATPPEAASSEHPAGMGIRFQYGEEGGRERVEAVVEGLMVGELGEGAAGGLMRRG